MDSTDDSSHRAKKGAKQVISFIEQPSVIRRILKHLDLWKSPRPPPEPLKLVCEPFHSRISVPWQDDVPGTPGNHELLAMLVSEHLSGTARLLAMLVSEHLSGTARLLAMLVSEEEMEVLED